MILNCLQSSNNGDGMESSVCSLSENKSGDIGPSSIDNNDLAIFII